ncbi:hypothetical protein MGSAQ_000729 [marine sediment metagenome]|uniref:Uncharacterized protein n=1 Tax=marine sediment metagenome TaxID=412755 RepID=A0A1B6NWE9_9ZZZZ
MQILCAAFDIQATWQNTAIFTALLNTILHDLPNTI